MLRFKFLQPLRERRSLRRAAFILALTLSSVGSHATLQAGDGAPWLNAVGRFLGAGYSYHGYHSPQGRPNAVIQNHPASSYPSSHFPSIYLPAEYAIPAHRPVYASQPAGRMVPQAAATPQPTPAPALAPVGPPPKWLEPYLKDRLPPPGIPLQPHSVERGTCMERSPSDQPPTSRINRSKSEPMEAVEVDLLRQGASPYDVELLPAPHRNPADGIRFNDDWLNGTSADDFFLEGNGNFQRGNTSQDDLLEADSRFRLPRHSVPQGQSTTHRYTPFR
jgi:hypothetical protein